ncbi:S41 family peptidase [Vagococcus zengguangii]|nr:S41 family peptidase [Vagococcus zengguangii]
MMERYGIYSTEHDFKAQIPEFKALAKQAHSFEEALPVLNSAAVIAGGHHSFIKAFSDEELNGAPNFTPVSPSVRINKGIATIYLPTFSSDDAQLINDYIQSVTKQLAQASELKGVIIDLRNNLGGNIIPMFGAVTSLFPKGDLLYYVDNQQQEFPIKLAENHLIIDDEEILSLNEQTKYLNLPIAILTNGGTASAAEILLVAFKGQPHVKQFGEATAGLATGVASFQLYKNYYVALAGVKAKDLNGKIYEEQPIEADVVTEHPEQVAWEWLTKIFNKK